MKDETTPDQSFPETGPAAGNVDGGEPAVFGSPGAGEEASAAGEPSAAGPTEPLGDEGLAEGRRGSAGSEPFAAPAPPSPYYTAPQYAAPWGWRTTSKATLPRISTAVMLGAFGSILVVMALGLWIAIATGPSGRLVLVSSAGICLLIVAAVLAYAALRGLSAKWFLVASAIGAFALGPVVGNGVSIAQHQSYEAEMAAVTVSGSTTAYSPQMVQVEDQLLATGLRPDDSPQYAHYDWTQFSVFADHEDVVLDLTSAPQGVPSLPSDYTIFATSGSQVIVLMRPDQVPMVWTDGETTSQIAATIWTEPGQTTRQELIDWASSEDPSGAALEFWAPYNGDWDWTSLDIQAYDSKVLLVQVADPAVRETAVTTGSDEWPQSDNEAPQSGGAPQSDDAGKNSETKSEG